MNIEEGNVYIIYNSITEVIGYTNNWRDADDIVDKLIQENDDEYHWEGPIVYLENK